MDYVHEFRQVVGRLRSWPGRLLIHHFRVGLDGVLLRVCVVRGIPNQLQDWFWVVVELDTGLQEFWGGTEDPPRPWRAVERPRDNGRKAQCTVPGTSGPSPCSPAGTLGGGVSSSCATQYPADSCNNRCHAKENHGTVMGSTPTRRGGFPTAISDGGGSNNSHQAPAGGL